MVDFGNASLVDPRLDSVVIVSYSADNYHNYIFTGNV